MASRAGVLLHGRGGTPGEMTGLAARLGFGDVRWVAPAAPAGSWYPRRFMEPLASNEPFLSQAIEQCDRAVDDAGDRGRVDPRHIILLGFSQGACLITEYVLRHPGRCGICVVFTGGLIGPEGTDWAASGANLSGLRVLITGGDIDEWIPEARVHETARVLAGLGADVELHIYKGRPHLVSDEELVTARDFIERSFRSERDS
jgi:phospholipase/carboxylesterase